MGSPIRDETPTHVLVDLKPEPVTPPVEQPATPAQTTPPPTN